MIFDLLFNELRTMQCYTRSDDFFGEVERFVRLQREAGNINHADQSKQKTVQLGTIKGRNGI